MDVVEVFSRADRIAPLQIITPEGDTSYFVKLVDADSSAAIMTMFIRGGQTFEACVPLGRIRVRFATGTVWQGTEELFGPETAFQEADRLAPVRHRFSEGVSGYTIRLIHANPW